VRSPQAKQLLTLRPSAFAPAASGSAAPIEPLALAPVAALARLLADHRSEGTRPDLGTARIVIGGGISLGSAENFHRLERLADRLGAAIGATRAAVDAGYAPNDWQVGQTGKVIAPDLYIAFGISGALQHLAGIGGARTIVAVNTDADAPLMKLADLTLSADLFAVLDALDAELTRLGVNAA
jgi:electron transfer flavoprotein alpha subunit